MLGAVVQETRICSFNFTTVCNVYVVLYYVKAWLYVHVFDVSVELISVQKLTRNKEATKFWNKTKTFYSCFVNYLTKHMKC